jgi:hypothetical protein
MPVQFGALTSTSGQNVSSVTFAHTVSSTQYAAGTKLLLVVVTFIDNSVTPTNITYNGVGMTRISLSGSSGGGVSQASGDYPRIEYWYYLNPPTGVSYNVVVTFASANYIQAAAWSFSGVNATTPLASFASTSGLIYPAGSQTASVSLASSTGSIAVNTIAGWNTFSNTGYGSGQNALVTPWATSADGAWEAAGSAKITSSVATTMSWTVSTGGTDMNLYRYLLTGLVVQSNDATFGGNNITSSYSFSRLQKFPSISKAFVSLKIKFYYYQPWQQPLSFSALPRYNYAQVITNDSASIDKQQIITLTTNPVVYKNIAPSLSSYKAISSPPSYARLPVPLASSTAYNFTKFGYPFGRYKSNAFIVSAEPIVLFSGLTPRYKYAQVIQQDLNTVNRAQTVVLTANSIIYNKIYAVPNFSSAKYPVAISASPVTQKPWSLVSSPGFRNFFSRAGNANAISANPKLLTSPSSLLPRWKYLQLYYDPMAADKQTLIVINSNTFTKNIRTSGIVVSYVFWS